MAALAVAVASCRESLAPPETPPEPITIAGTRAATGPLRPDGLNMERGIRLAVDMLNEAGGIDGREVRLIMYDDNGDPHTASNLYQELVRTDSIDLLIGPFASSVTQAVVPVAEAAARPLIAPLAGAHEIWGGQHRRWSVQMLNNARENLSGAVVVAAREGARKVALVYEDSRFPVSAAGGVRDVTAEQGLELVMDEAYPVGEADHAALVARARNLGADFLLGGGYTEDAVAFTGAVAEADYHPLLTSWSVGPSEPDFPERVGIEPARCVIGNAPWVASLGTAGLLATSEVFVRRYEAASASPRATLPPPDLAPSSCWRRLPGPPSWRPARYRTRPCATTSLRPPRKRSSDPSAWSRSANPTLEASAVCCVSSSSGRTTAGAAWRSE